MATLIPAGLIAGLPTDLFPTTVTVKQFSASATSSDESSPTYAAVTGLSGIKARIYNLSRQFGSQDVVQTDPDASHAILLNGYYTGVESGMVVFDDDSGEIYDVLREVADGGSTLTKLMCQRKP